MGERQKRTAGSGRGESDRTTRRGWQADREESAGEVEEEEKKRVEPVAESDEGEGRDYAREVVPVPFQRTRFQPDLTAQTLVRAYSYAPRGIITAKRVYIRARAREAEKAPQYPQRRIGSGSTRRVRFSSRYIVEYEVTGRGTGMLIPWPVTDSSRYHRQFVRPSVHLSARSSARRPRRRILSVVDPPIKELASRDRTPVSPIVASR